MTVKRQRQDRPKTNIHTYGDIVTGVANQNPADVADVADVTFPPQLQCDAHCNFSYLELFVAYIFLLFAWF